MKREEILRVLKVLNILSYPVCLVILYFMYPLFSNIDENIKYLLVWIAIFGLGGVYFNHKNIVLISRVKETANIFDLLNSIGKVKVKQNPENYFSLEDYNKYKNNLKYMFIYFGISMTFMFLIIFILF